MKQRIAGMQAALRHGFLQGYDRASRTKVADHSGLTAYQVDTIRRGRNLTIKMVLQIIRHCRVVPQMLVVHGIMKPLRPDISIDKATIPHIIERLSACCQDGNIKEISKNSGINVVNLYRIRGKRVQFIHMKTIYRFMLAGYDMNWLLLGESF